MARSFEVFDQLLPCQWRGVEFPITRIRTSIAHDLVEHKYWGVDGARLEATGLEPMRIQASIPLLNTIVPGKAERWSVLFPNAWRELAIAFAKKSTGIFQHPELGEIACKAEKLEMDISGDVRAGTMIEASWVETTIDGDQSALEFPSPVAEVELAALDLDASDDDLRTLVPQLPEFKESWASVVDKFTAQFDQLSLAANRPKQTLDAIGYRARSLGRSIERAATPLTWRATRNIERIKAAVNSGLAESARAGSKVLKYAVPADTTMAGIAAHLGASVNDLMRLNPLFVTSCEVKRGSVIRYYAPAVAA